MILYLMPIIPYVIRSLNVSFNTTKFRSSPARCNTTLRSISRMLKCTSNAQPSKSQTRTRKKDYNTGIGMEITLLMISGALWCGLMRSIGTLGLHNEAVYFEKLVLPRTLRTCSLYLCSKVPQFTYLRTSHGTTRASYNSTMMSLIDPKSQLRSLQSRVDVLRVGMKKSTKSAFANGKQTFLTILISSHLETV